MQWLFELFIDQDSVPHALLIISLVISSGLALGRLSLFGIELGIAGVLFSGLVFGHFGNQIDAEVMVFLREFGLILFVYAIGLEVGPGFINSLLRFGIHFNALAAGVVILGGILTIIISYSADLPVAVAVGLFSGATTNTPSLAAAQQILGSLPHIDSETLKMPGLGYAVAYPFGIVGIILSMQLIKKVYKVNIKNEAEAFARVQQENAHIPVCKDLTVENVNLNQCCIADIPFIEGVVITRILHDGEVCIATPGSRLYVGDTVRVVGDKGPLKKLKMLIGPESAIDLQQMAKNIYLRRFMVTHKQAIGKSIGQLCLTYGVTISRIHRADVEFSPMPGVHVQFGDELHIVGNEEALAAIEKALGNSLEELNHPQIVPVFIGITLGIILGSMPIIIPGMPSAVKLGLAGGPLIVAIILSRIGNWRAMTWHLPKSSNIILKDMGIVLFLACVGLNSGDRFVDTLIHGDGFYWMSYAALITLLPLLTMAFVAQRFYRINYLSLCGLLAGSMTDPPALAFANSLNPSAAVSIAYATVYPLVMILRIIAAQLIVFLIA